MGKDDRSGPARKAVQDEARKCLPWSMLNSTACASRCKILPGSLTAGALFLVDMVTSLGGVDVGLDKIGMTSLTAEARSVFPAAGLSPISFNGGDEGHRNQEKPVPNWYLDMICSRIIGNR